MLWLLSSTVDAKVNSTSETEALINWQVQTKKHWQPLEFLNNRKPARYEKLKFQCEPVLCRKLKTDPNTWRMVRKHMSKSQDHSIPCRALHQVYSQLKGESEACSRH